MVVKTDKEGGHGGGHGWLRVMKFLAMQPTNKQPPSIMEGTMEIHVVYDVKGLEGVDS